MSGTDLQLAPGLRYWPGYLDRAGQDALLAEVRALLEEAPLFRPRMPRTGAPFSVQMSNGGPLGWLSDERGYRYEPAHPETGKPWPAIPPVAMRAWSQLSGYAHRPEACLINRYEPGARMGLHQDSDEEALDAPVVSLSLGDTAVFRYGGLRRSDPTRSIRLVSGDALVIGGPSRFIFHGIDRVIPDTSTLLPEGGRFNLTLRRVSRPR